MTFHFKKGKHRASPLYWLRWWPVLLWPAVIQRKVQFDFSTKYDFGDADQADVNKLFGIQSGLNKKNRIRFGWRYDPGINKFILFSYINNSNGFSFEKICECVANHSYLCVLENGLKAFYFTVYNEKLEKIGQAQADKKRKVSIAFLLGPFFGGNRPAPHDMTLKLSKK